jgi:hypothetical protein
MRAAQSNQTENIVPGPNLGLPGRAPLVQSLPMRPHACDRDGRARSRSALRSTAIALLLALLAAAASAAERGGGADRWVPSFATYFEFIGQKATGSVVTSNVLGPPLDPNDDELDLLFDGNGCLTRNTFTDEPSGRTGKLCNFGQTGRDASVRPTPEKIDPDDNGGDTSVAPLVGGSLGLMTPSPFDGFLYPRLFVHGDYAASFSFERNLAGKGKPDTFLPPETYSPRANDIEELSIRGQGSRTRWQLDRDVWSAGGGIAFTSTWFQRTVRIKPSFEWIHFSQDFIGVVHRAVKQQIPSVPRGSNFSDVSRFRFIELTQIETKTFDAIGPGLELEVDTARLGPIQTSVFAMGRGYRILDDTDQVLATSNQYGESATWTFEPEQWMWRAGVGIRFHWLPERD